MKLGLHKNVHRKKIHQTMLILLEQLFKNSQSSQPFSYYWPNVRWAAVQCTAVQIVFHKMKARLPDDRHQSHASIHTRSHIHKHTNIHLHRILLSCLCKNTKSDYIDLKSWRADTWLCVLRVQTDQTFHHTLYKSLIFCTHFKVLKIVKKIVTLNLGEDSLFGLGVCTWAVLMGLVFQAVLSFIPVKQCPQDGGKTILSKRAHSADQLWGNIGSNFRKLFINCHSTNCTAQNAKGINSMHGMEH